MPTLSAAQAFYPDGTFAEYFRVQDAQDKLTDVRVTVPAGHSAVLRVDIQKATGGIKPGVYQFWFPGATTTDTGALAPEGGSDETIPLPVKPTPAWEWSDGFSTWR